MIFIFIFDELYKMTVFIFFTTGGVPREAWKKTHRPSAARRQLRVSTGARASRLLGARPVLSPPTDSIRLSLSPDHSTLILGRHTYPTAIVTSGAGRIWSVFRCCAGCWPPVRLGSPRAPIVLYASLTCPAYARVFHCFLLSHRD